MGFPPLTWKETCPGGPAGEGWSFARAMLLLPHSRPSGVFAQLPHLDVLCPPGPALPQGGGSHLGPSTQPCRPLRGARGGCLGTKRRYGCAVPPVVVPPCPAQANTAEGNASYWEQLKTGACTYLRRDDHGVRREGLVFEGDTDGFVGAQVDLRPEVVTEVEHLLLHWCNTLGQLLEVTPLPWVQYDTGGASSRGAGEDLSEAGATLASPQAHRGDPPSAPT